jgi:hypothetical protein
MNNICERDKSVYWINSNGGHGFCDIDQVTDTGAESFETFDNEAEYLARLEELNIPIEKEND